MREAERVPSKGLAAGRRRRACVPTPDWVATSTGERHGVSGKGDLGGSNGQWRSVPAGILGGHTCLVLTSGAEYAEVVGDMETKGRVVRLVGQQCDLA